MRLALEDLKPLEWVLHSKDNAYDANTPLIRFVCKQQVKWKVYVEYRNHTKHIGDYWTIEEAKEACNQHKLNLINQELV